MVPHTMEAFERDIETMWPAMPKPLWRRRHLVFEPSFGVIQMPGLVGRYRPHWRAPNVEGLWFATRRSGPAASAPTGPPAPR